MSADGNTGTRVSRVRRAAFRVAVALFSLAVAVGFSPVLQLIGINWLPGDAWLALRDIPPAALGHRLHSTALAVIVWGMLIGVAVQLHRPRRKVGAMLMALAVPPAIAAGEALTGTYTVMGTAPWLAALLLIALLHPAARELLGIDRMDPLMSGLTAVAAVPWIAFAVGQAGLGRARLHGEVEHWTFMGSLSILVVLWGLLGASDRPGWKFPAGAAVIASAIVGLQSIIFPELLSRAPLPWAAAALTWAVGYLIAGARRHRRRRSTA